MKLKSKKTLVLFLSLLVAIGIVIRILTPQLTPPTPPSYPLPSLNPNLQSPSLVNLNQLKTTDIPKTANSYSFTLFNFQILNPITTTFNFTSPPESFGEIRVFKNNLFNLTIDPTNHQINYTYNDNSITLQSGNYQNPESLLDQLSQTIKSLNIYPNELGLKLIEISYKKLEGAYLVPSTQPESNVIQLDVAPTIEGKPIYIQQQPLIIATFNRQNLLIKLDVYYPISSVNIIESTNLLSLSQIKALPPKNFFPIYITPSTTEEGWKGPSGLSNITPQDITQSYLLDNQNKILHPIFTLSSSQSNSKNFIYATLAYPTQ